MAQEKNSSSRSAEFTAATSERTTNGGNLNAALTYALGWLTGLVFLLVEKEDDFVRFNAAQSLVVFGVLTILAMVPVLGWILSPFVMLIGVVLWVFLIVKTYQGEKVVLPLAGQLASQLAEKVGK